MDELIVVQNDNDKITLSARALYKFLEIKKRFSEWFETNSQGFTEGIDYSRVYLKVQANRYGGEQEIDDYQISIEMGKHICLMSRTEKGKEYRNYLIKVEMDWNSPDKIMERALAIAHKRVETLTLENKMKDQQLAELKPKADYTDTILSSTSLMCINQIAKDYGYSAASFNKLLHDYGVIYKQADQWLLYAKYQANGYTSSETIHYRDSLGREHTKLNTKWTQKGRLFLYELLKKNNVLPQIEKLGA